MVNKKIELIRARWNWMVNERTTTTKSVNEIWREADIKFKGWKD